MSTVANGASAFVCATIFPEGSMIHPTPPHAPLGSARFDDTLNAPDRTAATTPTDSHLAVVAAAVARGERMICTPRAAYAAYVSSAHSSVQMLRPKEHAPAWYSGKSESPRSNQRASQLPASSGR